MKTDGTEDEAPRYLKTLATVIDLFIHLNSEVVLHGVNAAGLSVFNWVERRMAPLSHDLAGLLLPHDHYGNYLDSSGKTINIKLEKILQRLQRFCRKSGRKHLLTVILLNVMQSLLERSTFHQTQIPFDYQTIVYSPITAYK